MQGNDEATSRLRPSIPIDQGYLREHRAKTELTDEAFKCPVSSEILPFICNTKKTTWKNLQNSSEIGIVT